MEKQKGLFRLDGTAESAQMAFLYSDVFLSFPDQMSYLSLTVPELGSAAVSEKPINLNAISFHIVQHFRHEKPSACRAAASTFAETTPCRPACLPPSPQIPSFALSTFQPRPRPRPRPRPLPPPLPRPPRPPGPAGPPRSASFRALFLGLGASSMRRVSSGRESGRIK